MPKCSMPLSLVEAEAMDFLKSILEKEEDDVKRYKKIDVLKNTVWNLQKISSCIFTNNFRQTMKTFRLDN